MSYTDAASRIAQIQSQMAALQTAFDPAAASQSTTASTPTSGTSSTSFATALAQAQGQSAFATPSYTPNVAATGGASVSSAALPAAAQSQLTTSQQQFAMRLAADTGLSPAVVCAWELAEESGGAAQSRQSANNNDWLNIGYTDSGTYGSADSVWSDPSTAADATAGWLKGQDTIPGYGTASSGIQAIMQTVGQSPQAQMAAIQTSGWAGGGYPDLPGLYQQVGGT